MTVTVEAFFDESEASVGPPILCVAGYVLKKHQSRKLSRDWNETLKRKHLPYFRMSACAHGNDPFDKLSKYGCINVEKRMIQLIKEHTVLGLAATVNVTDFAEVMPKHPGIGTPYSFLARVVLAGVGEYLRRTPTPGKVAYFFEAGHASQSEANSIMNLVFSDPMRCAHYQYGGHAFVPKIRTPGVQAADLLAWQWYTDHRHQAEGWKRRKDCAALLEHRHHALHYDRERLVEKAIAIEQAATAKNVPIKDVWLD